MDSALRSRIIILAFLLMTEETKIKQDIKDYLRKRGVFFYHNLACLGSYKGIPDITAIFQGKVYQIEVKTPTGKLSSAQQDFRDKWQEQGGALIVGGLEQVVRVIEYDHPIKNFKKYKIIKVKLCDI